jgi:hypothetical protein
VAEPLVAVIVLSIAGALQRRTRSTEVTNPEPGTQKSEPATRNHWNSEPGTRNRERGFRAISVFAVAWLSAFLLPVLPVVARNELYLYLPAFGLSVLAAQVVEASVDLSRRSRHVWSAVAIFSTIFGLYQVSRSWEMHGELVFSGRLVDELASVDGPARILVVGEDESTRQLLKDTVADYLPAVLMLAAADGRLIAADSDHPAAQGVIRLRCSYHDGRLVFARN